jgi:hypothetical protein
VRAAALLLLLRLVEHAARWCVLPVRAQLKLACCRHCNTTEFQDLTQQQIDSWFDDHNTKVQQCP